MSDEVRLCSKLNRVTVVEALYCYCIEGETLVMKSFYKIAAM